MILFFLAVQFCVIFYSSIMYTKVKNIEIEIKSDMIALNNLTLVLKKNV